MTTPGVEHAAHALAWQARACGRLGSPMYEGMLTALADDVVAGGPARAAFGDLVSDGAELPSVPGLRLAGGLHRLVLEGEAPGLEEFYPSVGGRWDLGGAWQHVLAVIDQHGATLRRALDLTPQTNEVGRSAALVGGLLRTADRFALPVRLLEIGASAGLNLRADHFRFGSPSGWWGPADSPVVMADAWAGPLPPVDAPLEVVERRGFDLAPLDVARAEDRRTLEAYTWPDMTERLVRLRAACEVAADVPAVVERSSAGDALDAVELERGVATVVWHSVMWQYVGKAERARVDARIAALAEQADPDRVLARVTLEDSGEVDGTYSVVLTTWPFGEATVIGAAPPHGLPTTWTG
ncbi:MULTISPECIES: DUF2332 family protein [unclassified Mumia]|uniref:DUF2332 domain-containing protein n=1 Tax=unclassified Mumia TaxID=2621872 RepID=UPI00261A95F3|nr:MULTISPECIES: DUF2332 family protein [unclassified Mumia]MDD9347282.1 DUF2332 family protein [Mumia sp.]